MRMPVSAALLVWAALDLAALSGAAQADLSGPANLPPAGYDGLQFVDSRGCLFLRAGYGAQTVWVPMVDEGKNQICNMAPSGGASAAAAPAAEPAPAPKPAPVAAPAAAPVVVAAAPAVAAPVVAAPVQAAPAARNYQVAALGTATASCTTRAPVLERVILRNGGTALVCTLGDGTLTGWEPPIFAAGAGVGAALGYADATPQSMRGARLAGQVTAAAPARATVATSPAQVAATIPPPPKGWKLAWKDDRLNPKRGVGTAEGQAQMDALWTREVPANLVTEPAKPVVFALPVQLAAPAAAPVARVSTMSAPAPKQTTVGAERLYVQIGSFSVAANAAGAAAQIAALGLPSASGQQSQGGTALQVVFAGPFADAGTAQAALARLRSAGFSDAFIR